MAEGKIRSSDLMRVCGGADVEGSAGWWCSKVVLARELTEWVGNNGGWSWQVGVHPKFHVRNGFRGLGVRGAWISANDGAPSGSGRRCGYHGEARCERLGGLDDRLHL